MIFILSSLVYCTKLNDENLYICNQSKLIHTELFQIINTVINLKHNIINKELFLFYFKDEDIAEKKVDYIFETLNEAYKIISDGKYGMLRHLMIGCYDLGDTHNLHNYKSILLSNFLTRIVELASYNLETAGVLHQVNSNLSLIVFPINTNRFIRFSTYEKANEYILIPGTSTWKLNLNLSIFENILMIEMLYLSIHYEIEYRNILNYKFIAEEELNLASNFTSHIFHNYVEEQAYIKLDKKFFAKMKFSSSPLSLVYDDYDDKAIFNISSKSYGSEILISQKHCSPNWAINRLVILENKYIDLCISQLQYYCRLTIQEMLIKITKIDDKSSSLILLNIGEINNIDIFLEYLRKTQESTKDMQTLIEKNIKEDKLHSFTTVVDLITYNFDHPVLDNNKIPSKCLRLSCGHFIGKELLKEYFIDLKCKCHLCNKKTTVSYYFEAVVYEEKI